MALVFTYIRTAEPAQHIFNCYDTVLILVLQSLQIKSFTPSKET